VQAASDFLLFHVSCKCCECHAGGIHKGAKLFAINQRVSVIPPALGQLAVHKHVQAFAKSGVSTLSHDFERQKRYGGGVYKRVGSCDPGPALYRGVVGDRVSGIVGPVLSGCFEQEIDCALISLVKRTSAVPGQNGNCSGPKDVLRGGKRNATVFQLVGCKDFPAGINGGCITFFLGQS